MQQNKSHLWTKEAKTEHISENTNVNRPANYKSKYNKLIHNHFAIASVDKTDLGHVKNVPQDSPDRQN
jgi:hypothetical protein